jgi:hypothetical protein
MSTPSPFNEACPASAPFFGFIGAAAALVFASTLARFPFCYSVLFQFAI